MLALQNKSHKRSRGLAIKINDKKNIPNQSPRVDRKIANLRHSRRSRVGTLIPRVSERRFTKSPRQRWLRKSRLLFVNIDPTKSSNLTGWALSNNYKIVTPRDFPDVPLEDKKDTSALALDLFGSKSVNTMPSDIRGDISAIIWRPPTFDIHSDIAVSNHIFYRSGAPGDTYGKSTSSKNALEADYSGLISVQLERALGAYGYADNKAGRNSLMLHSRPLVVVVHEPGDPLWGRRGAGGNGVVVFPTPLTALALSSALSLTETALGTNVNSPETYFPPQRPPQKAQRY